jgi:hypothetical protein
LSFFGSEEILMFDIGIGSPIGSTSNPDPKQILSFSTTFTELNSDSGGKRIYAPVDGIFGSPGFPEV